MRQSPLGPALLGLSGLPKARRVCLKLALRLEGGQFYSSTARAIMAARYGISIGAYSYGSCFKPGEFPPGVQIGCFASIAQGVSILRRNHPLDRLSTHPFFFNSRLGHVASDNMPFKPLVIEHDAWIGERVIVTPGCVRIGIGSVVGAGAVVTRDVGDFMVVAGNPAKPIKRRFSDELCVKILASRWWYRTLPEILACMEHMTTPLDQPLSQHALLG